VSGSPGTLEIRLGQRRPLIRQMRLIVDQTDSPGMSKLPQRGRNLKTRMAGANDQHSFVCHGSDLSIGKRNGPWSFLCSTILLLLQAVVVQRTGSRRPHFADFAGIVTPSLLLFIGPDGLLETGPCKMPITDPATASSPTIRAARHRWSIATITLNRPAAYNSIDITIAKKLEQLAPKSKPTTTFECS